MTPQETLKWFKVKYILEGPNDVPTPRERNIPALNLHEAKLWAYSRWGRDSIISVELIPVVNALIWGKK